MWLRELRRAGYRASGIDASAALARIARRAAPGCSVKCGSVYSARLPRCDAITAIGEVLSYRPPNGRPPPSLGRLFGRAARSLRPGGLFVFDLLVEGPRMGYRTWRAGRDWVVLVEIQEDLDQRRLVREITTFRRVGSAYRRRRERHELRVCSRAEVESALRAAGFSVRVSRRYGDLDLPPRRMAFRARLH